MQINIKESNVIREQDFYISDHVSIIYGYNNSGKTTVLKSIEKALCDKIKENYFNNDSILYTYIPTNRVVVSDSIVGLPEITDIEELIKYEEEIYKGYNGYNSHLKTLRDYLLKYKTINNFLFEVIKDLFCIELPRNDDLFIEDKKYSDGIENIINIYLNIIWLLTWNLNIDELDYSKLKEILANRQAYILIDEIEMFLHVNIQAKLINALKKDFNKCGFVLTTHSPLLLTRYSSSKIYNVEDGKLNILDQKLFYQDLNRIFEVYFYVDEFPENVKQAINYLGDIITKKAKVDKSKIDEIDKLLEEEYPSLHRKYNSAIVKAKFIGDNDV